MRFGYELKKLTLSPVIMGWVSLCIIFNTFITLTSYNEGRPNDKVEAVNIFETFQTSEIAEGYIRKYNVPENYADNIRNKYNKLQPIVDQKARNGDALSTYFSNLTYYRHSMLFEIMFMAIIAEICMLALLVSLLSVIFEQMSRTAPIIYASSIGRRILNTKLYASLFAAMFWTVVIVSTSLIVFFLKFDFSSVWQDNVSSMFNYAVNEFGKPFITWRNFTVVGYLRATIGISLGLVICFCLLGYVVGVWIHSAYGAFMTAVSLISVMFFVKLLLPIGSVSRSLLNLTPIWLWKNSGQWFTDGWADILWANFEIIGLMISLALLSTLAFLATRCFYRRELD